MSLEDWGIEITIRNKKDPTKWAKLQSGGKPLDPDTTLLPHVLVELHRIINDHDNK